jgi:hypothetical protein
MKASRPLQLKGDPVMTTLIPSHNVDLASGLPVQRREGSRGNTKKLLLVVGALVLVAVVTTGVALGQTEFTNNKDGGHLYIHLPGRFPVDFSMPYVSTQTGKQLAEQVAKKVGVRVQYLVLFRSSTELVQRHGPSSALTHMDRAPEYRIDAGPNADKTLQEQGVMASDSLKLLLRPLRGDHIHYAFSIYYKGELVDKAMIQDRPVLAVASNISQQDKDSGDVCSPDKTDTGAKGSSAEPSYVGPKVWEGNHIDTVFPHFGAHVGHPSWFGFNLMHIHPATAWPWFEESEGLGANLDTLLEQVGIWVWEEGSRRYPFHTPFDKVKPGEVIVDFPAGLKTVKGTELVSNVKHNKEKGWSYCDYPTNRLLIANDKDYVWRLYYWPFSRDLGNFSVLTERFGRVWLHENMGMITLSYEEKHNDPISKPPLPDPDKDKQSIESIEYLWSNNDYFKVKEGGKTPKEVPHDQSGPKMLGFDGDSYPMPNMPCDFCRQFAKDHQKDSQEPEAYCKALSCSK